MALTRVSGKVLNTAVATVAALPTTGYTNQVIWVHETATNYKWNGSAWAAVANVVSVMDDLPTVAYEGQVVEVLGYLTAGDGGGGTFRYTVTTDAVANGGTVFNPALDYSSPNYNSTAGTGAWYRQYSGAVNVKWFGITTAPAYIESGVWFWDSSIDKSTANLGTIIDPTVALTFTSQGTGSGTGCLVRQYKGALRLSWFGATGSNSDTLASVGETASAIYWHSGYTDSAKSPLVSPATATSTAMLSSTDTMDTLALQKAIFAAVDAGVYSLYIDMPNVYLSKCVVMIQGQKVNLEGMGQLKSIIRNENCDSAGYSDTRFDSAKCFSGTKDVHESLLFLFTLDDGAPLNISNLGFEGKTGYNWTSGPQFKLIGAAGVNGLYVKDCWFTSASYGLYSSAYSGRVGSDWHINNIVSEYCFEATIYADTLEFSLYDSNIWQSHTSYDSLGVYNAVGGKIYNTRFIGFQGASVTLGDDSIVSGCYIPYANKGASIVVGDDSKVTDNYISGGTSITTIVTVGSSSVVSGNYIKTAGDHPCLSIGGVGALSNDSTVVTGNTFIKTTATAPNTTTNNAIQDTNIGTAYYGAAKNAVITGNTFNGNAATILGFNNLSNTIDTNSFSAIGNLRQSVGFFKTTRTISIPNGTTNITTIDGGGNYDGVNVRVLVGGILQGVGSYSCYAEIVGSFGPAASTPVVITNTEDGNATAKADIAVVLTPSANVFTLQITNANANSFDASIRIEIGNGVNTTITQLV